VEEDSQTNIEDIGVAFVAGVEVELVESFEVVTEVAVDVELVERFEVVTDVVVDVELVESFEVELRLQLWLWLWLGPRNNITIVGYLPLISGISLGSIGIPLGTGGNRHLMHVWVRGRWSVGSMGGGICCRQGDTQKVNHVLLFCGPNWCRWIRQGQCITRDRG